MLKSIPLIDLGGNVDPHGAAAQASAAALHDALSTLGFAYISGHTVPSATRAAAFAASRRFHESPLELKQSLAINAAHRGYMGMATSTIVTSSVAKVTKPNMSESLMLMHELPPDDPGLLAGLPMQGPNQWPDWLPDFKPAMEQYVREVDVLGRYIVRLIAISLGLPATALDHHFDHPTTFLRALHYPPQPPQDDDQMGSAPHTDYGIITLLAQDDSGGDRYSLPYFLDPSMDALIECLPTCTDATHPPLYPPVPYGEYLMERLNKNYDYRRDTSKATA